MSEFSGKVRVGKVKRHYTLKFGTQIIPQCGDVMYEVDQEMYNRWPAHGWHFAWGYDGDEPLILGMALLGLYTGYAMHGMWSHDIMIEGLKPGMPHKSKAALIKKHYRTFTSEVIANLPDNWTMTMEEIDAWVKDGTLPKCITNQLKET